MAISGLKGGLFLLQQHQLDTFRVGGRHHPGNVQARRHLATPGIPTIPNDPVLTRLPVAIDQARHFPAQQIIHDEVYLRRLWQIKPQGGGGVEGVGGSSAPRKSQPGARLQD